MKRLICIILSAALVALLCFGAYAADVDVTNDGNTIFTDSNWAYEKVNNYGYEINSYIGSSPTANVPYSFAKEYVTTIGEHAFNENAVVVTVNLHEFIESVGDYAFNYCPNLETVKFFASTTSIGVGCFYGCPKLSSVNLEDSSIPMVPAYCFAESGISELALPGTCTSIGNMAFYNCASLTKLTVPDSVTSISDTAFTNAGNVVIYCNTDSFAHIFAEANGYEYVLMDAPVEVTFILGDADGDGEVTVLDATKVQRVLAVLIGDDDGMIALRGDCNSDGLDILDATKIQRFIADFDTEEPVGETVTKIV